MISELIILTECNICPKNQSSLNASVRTFDLMIQILICKELVLTFKCHFLTFIILPLGGALYIKFKKAFQKYHLFTCLNSISLINRVIKY